MIIKDIELNNFRIYQGSNLIELSPEEGKNIILVSGRNGFGKTTFLMSLVWCLYGRQMQEVDDLYKKEISDQGSYAKYIANSLNRKAKVDGQNTFFVSITFSEVNIKEVPCKEIKIKRSFNILTSTSEEVEILIDGRASELSKEVGPEIFIRDFIMPIEIAKFFFFDAEKIVSLAEVNTPEQKRALSKAYSEVLGIKKYEDLKAELEGLQIKIRQESASASEKAEFKKLEAELSTIDEQIQEYHQNIDESREKRNEKNKDIRDIQEKLIKSGSLITVEELQEFRERENVLVRKQEILQNDLKDSYEFIPFAIAAGKLLEVEDQLENEANFKAAQYKEENISGVTGKILTDLLNIEKPKNLTIDHQIHSWYSTTFEKLIRKHFFDNSPALPSDFELIHDFSDSERARLNSLLNNIKLSFREKFKTINSEYIFTKNEVNGIRRKIRDAESNQEDPIIESYRNQKDALQKEVVKIEENIDSFNRAVGDLMGRKTQLNKKIEELSRKLEVSDQKKEKDTVLSRQIVILKNFISEFKTKKKQSLEKQIFEGLSTLLHKKGFIRNVEVNIIGEDIDIVLRNGRGEEIKKESLSKGEQQMYATSILRGLVEESDFEFPVFIDSPMQKFDEQHAENIVKYFYPNVSDQVVLFPLINKEMTESEFNLLFNKIAKTYLINNVNEDSSEFMGIDPKIFLATYNNMYNAN
ncbi:DNA sulfur modification protein DndD [Algoriphagus sp.]|uniref:DNA sulfur modification protein DndD n=1 Tax=Algoriphagus sp. TaxID=1872435 RepID=UPI00271FB6A4|nr:DNA sulfur modification protein DndD [Algoriphagus sp.]MDO8968496.1 DNA sulfur modification protein DndD [Algoriphagus sp.]MDP3200727.1 DNA sulfur modification protein DndD [Algoriphagus sp.]